MQRIHDRLGKLRAWTRVREVADGARAEESDDGSERRARLGSAFGIAAIPALDKLIVWSMSVALVMSHGSFSCVVANSSALPSSDGDMTVSVAGAFTW